MVCFVAKVVELHITAYLKWNLLALPGNLTKVLLTVLKYNEETSAFQTILIELSKQPKKHLLG